MKVLKTEDIMLLRDYGNELQTFAEYLRTKNPAYVIAMPRKAPRLLELCRFWNIDIGDSTVITDRALKFGVSLKEKDILLVDDIIIVGSTISWFIKDTPELEHIEVLSLMRNSKWFTPELFKKPNLPSDVKVSSITVLSQRETSEFCTKIVQSFAYLNKPYDIDHPIFYSKLNTEALEEFCNIKYSDTVYEISTSFHRSINKRRFSILPNPSIENATIKALFRNGKIRPHIIKIRLYYDEITNSANFVPILIIPILELKIGEPFFGKHFNSYNTLIMDMIGSLPKSHKTHAFQYLLTYIASYLYGLSFFARNLKKSKNIFGFSQPSRFLGFLDLVYLFGPDFSEKLLYNLDILYPRTIEIMEDLFNYSSETQNRAREILLFPPNVDPFANDEDAKMLYEDIKPYLDNCLNKRKSLIDKVACIFEGLALYKEIPARNRIHAKKSLDGDRDRRLSKGFNYPQICQILRDYGIINYSDSELKIKISLIMDILIDKGVIVPFYKKYDGRFVRIYRYGEDWARQLKVGFLLHRVTKGLVKWSEDILNKPYIPKIAFEKILVMIKKKWEESGKDVEFLCTDGDVGLRTFNLKLGYHLHGAVVKYEAEEDQDWLSKWCLRKGIIQEMKEGYGYSDEFLKNMQINGQDNPEENSMVPDDMASKYQMLAQVLLYINEKVDKTHEEYLTCLSTCIEPKTTLDAMRYELKLLFEGEEKRPFGNNFSVEPLLSVLQDDLIKYLSQSRTDTKGLLDKCMSQLGWACKTAGSLIHKYNLFMGRERIIKDIQSHFQDLPESEYIRHMYERDLQPFIRKVMRSINAPLRSEEETWLYKVRILGELCVEICSILKDYASLTDTIIKGKLQKIGRTWGKIEQNASQQIETYLMNNGGVKQNTKSSSYEKWRIEFSHSTFTYYTNGTLYSRIWRNNDSITFNMWQYIDNAKIAEINQKIQIVNNVFPEVSIPLIPDISESYEGIAQVKNWAKIFRTLIQNTANVWNAMKIIYTKNFSWSQWEKIIKDIYPDTEELTPYKWIIWYDIKGSTKSENRDKTPRLKNQLIRVFGNLRDSLKDGKFVPELNETSARDDARYILVAKSESVPMYLKALLNTLNSFNMFARVGISSTDDTQNPIIRIPGSESLDSEVNFALAKRLGECIKRGKVEILRKYNDLPNLPHETNDAHSIILSNEVWRQIWAKQSLFGDLNPISVKFVVDREYEIHFFHKIKKINI